MLIGPEQAKILIIMLRAGRPVTAREINHVWTNDYYRWLDAARNILRHLAERGIVNREERVKDPDTGMEVMLYRLTKTGVEEAQILSDKYPNINLFTKTENDPYIPDKKYNTLMNRAIEMVFWGTIDTPAELLEWYHDMGGQGDVSQLFSDGIITQSSPPTITAKGNDYLGAMKPNDFGVSGGGGQSNPYKKKIGDHVVLEMSINSIGQPTFSYVEDGDTLFFDWGNVDMDKKLFSVTNREKDVKEFVNAFADKEPKLKKSRYYK